MHYTKIYADKDGHSRFEVVTVPVIGQGILGSVSLPVDIKTIRFCKNTANYNGDFYTAPARQFIVLLDGEIEITTSLGEVRRFMGGDVLFVEDITGYGHKTENVVLCIRESLFITV